MHSGGEWDKAWHATMRRSVVAGLLVYVLVAVAPVATRAATPVAVANAPLSPASTLVPLATHPVRTAGAGFATNTPRPRPPTSTPAPTRAATATAAIFPATVTRPAPAPPPMAAATSAATVQARVAPTPVSLPTARATAAPTRPVSRPLEPPPPPSSPPSSPLLVLETPTTTPLPTATATGSSPATPVAVATTTNQPADIAPQTATVSPVLAPVVSAAGATFAPPTPTVLFPPLATPEWTGERGATPVPAASPLMVEGSVRGVVLLALAAFAFGGGVLVLAGRLLWQMRRRRTYTRLLSMPHNAHPPTFPQA